MHVAVLGVMLTLCGAAHSQIGQRFFYGPCPRVPVPYYFSMRKMLGTWYVIQRTSTASGCIKIRYSRAPRGSKHSYKVEETSQNFLLSLMPIRHEYRCTGLLSVPNWYYPAAMTVDYPIRELLHHKVPQVASETIYYVLSARYAVYAAIFTCQKLAYAHRRSATILSRRRYLDRYYVDGLREMFRSYGINPFEMSVIDHNKCPLPPHRRDKDVVIVDIDDKTFTKENILGMAKKAMVHMENGVTYAIKALTNAYEKFRNRPGPPTQPSHPGQLGDDSMLMEYEDGWLNNTML